MSSLGRSESSHDITWYSQASLQPPLLRNHFSEIPNELNLSCKWQVVASDSLIDCKKGDL